MPQDIDPIRLAGAREQSGTFLKDNPPPVFIDEVQKAPSLFPLIKMDLDGSRKKGQFYLCGSQQFSMMKNVTESLAGRLGILNLSGLSVRERCGCVDKEPFLPTEEYFKEKGKDLPKISYQEVWNMIHRGSMPEMCADPDHDWQMFYGAYVRTYIERPAPGLSNRLFPIGFPGSVFIWVLQGRKINGRMQLKFRGKVR